MKTLDLDKMDEDTDEPISVHRDSFDSRSEASILTDDEEDDDFNMLIISGSGSRGQRMSGVEEAMFEMR
jgi:hypothetical protein